MSTVYATLKFALEVELFSTVFDCPFLEREIFAVEIPHRPDQSVQSLHPSDHINRARHGDHEPRLALERDSIRLLM